MDSTTLHNTQKKQLWEGSFDPVANLAPVRLSELAYRPMFL